MEKYLVRAIKAFNIVGVTAVMVMMFLTTADVFLRHVFNSPISGAYELSYLMLVAIVFLGLGYAELSGAHIKMDLLATRLPARSQKYLDIFGHVLVCVFTALLIWYGTIKAYDSWMVREFEMGIVKIPVYIFRPAIPLGALSFFSASVLRIVKIIKGTAQEEMGAGS
ncbi:TRAP transporter small permease subunit [Chloroflexota bacterium]